MNDWARYRVDPFLSEKPRTTLRAKEVLKSVYRLVEVEHSVGTHQTPASRTARRMRLYSGELRTMLLS